MVPKMKSSPILCNWWRNTFWHSNARYGLGRYSYTLTLPKESLSKNTRPEIP